MPIKLLPGSHLTFSNPLNLVVTQSESEKEKSDENPFEIWRLVRRQQANKTPRFPPYFLNIYFASRAVRPRQSRGDGESSTLWQQQREFCFCSRQISNKPPPPLPTKQSQGTHTKRPRHRQRRSSCMPCTPRFRRKCA